MATPIRSSSWCTIGNEYDVLMLLIDANRVQLRLASDERGIPALFPLSDFEIVDGTLPTNWTIARTPQGGIVLAPSPWLHESFWERYFDKDPGALATYKHERSIIIGKL